jgi:dCMP deaminase
MNTHSKDSYFMAVATVVASAASCSRRKVGAVLVRNGHIVSTGYNGAPKGLDHCVDVGCELENGHCVRAVHAELNALLQAGFAGYTTDGCTLYTTASPCRACMSAIINAGIKRIVFGELYRNETHQSDRSLWAKDVATKLGIVLVHHFS